jgi:uncharacterized lipoprotein
MKTQLTAAAVLAVLLAACSPDAEAPADTAQTAPAAETAAPVHADDDAAVPVEEDHGHEHADGEDADHAH